MIPNRTISMAAKLRGSRLQAGSMCKCDILISIFLKEANTM